MSYKSKYTGEQVENLLGKAGTSLQSTDISRVATTGSYNDLSNKPTIPDISGKQDILVSGTNIKTINGESILGSGDITIEGGNGGSDVVIPYAEYNGTSTAVVVNTISGSFPTTLTAGTRVSIKILNNITSITTVNVNGTGAKNVYYKGNSLAAGTINRYNTYDFIYDSVGYWRIIGINTDTDTHYTAKSVVTSSSTSSSNASASNGSVYLNIVENSTVRSSHNIKGTGATSVTSDASGNIIINTVSSDDSSNSGGGVYSEVNHGTSDTTFTLTPNTFHVWGEVTSLDLSLGDATSGVMNEYIFQFTSGSTATTLSLPDDIKWTEDIVIESNMIYQISIVNGLGAVLEFSAISSVMPITLYALSSAQSSSYINPPSDNPNANKLYEELMSMSNNTGQGNLDVGLVTLVLRIEGFVGSVQTNNITSYSLAPSYISEGILLLQQGPCYYILQQDGTIQSIFHD